MSTQTSFDLAGLSRAIQSQDRRYQLALYADNAELEILDSSHLEPPLQVLHGKPEIAKWLDAMSSRAVSYSVRDAVGGPDGVRFTEECVYPDGKTLVFECRADVSRGQIKHAELTMVHGAQEVVDTSATGKGDNAEGGTASGPTCAGATSAGGRSLHPASRSASRSPMPGRSRRSTRSVAGNFLG
jgi:hypothetical protein